MAPFVKAINEHIKFFMAKNIDMFKDGVTLPGLTLKLLFENIGQDTAIRVILGSR